MNTRDFKTWLSTMKNSIATWNYYTDFKKVYENVSKKKIELHILNSLIGSNNIEEEFLKIIDEYPNVLKVVPFLLAKRETEIKINDVDEIYLYDFDHINYTKEQYALFMRNSGLFDLLQNHLINNLFDYALGIEVGMDTNARKNRTGIAMEDLVESFLVKAGLVLNQTYFKQMTSRVLQERFHVNLKTLNNNGKAEKRFDFVLIDKFGSIFAIECNFYASSGSKLNETARSYKDLAIEAKGIPNFKFVWITDGKGWEEAKNNLEETFDVLDELYNLKDLEESVIDQLLNDSSIVEIYQK